MRTAPCAHHDGHRCGQPKSAWTSNNQHRNGVYKRMRQTRLGSRQKPNDQCRNGNTNHRGYEPDGDTIGESLNRSAAALRLADHLHDSRQQRL